MRKKNDIAGNSNRRGQAETKGASVERPRGKYGPKEKQGCGGVAAHSVLRVSAAETVDGLEHLVGGADDTGIRFVGALRDDHLDKFADDVHIGIFEDALLNGAKAFGTARIAGLVVVALLLNDFGSGGAGAKADLEACRERGLLSGGGTGRDETLVDQILELQTAAAETGSAGIGEIVGNVIEIQLLGFHSA